jgi:hypothetical protein
MTFCCFERATPQLAHVVRDVEWNALLNIVSRAPQHVLKEEVANVCRGLPHRLLQALVQQDT